MKVVFLCAFHSLSLAPSTKRGDSISHDLHITADTDGIKKHLLPNVVRSIGTMEAAFLVEAPAIVHSEVEVNESDFDGAKYLDSRMALTHLFIHMLWLVKDNAANVELGFLICDSLAGLRVHSNFRATRYSNSIGGDTVVAFDSSECRSARTLFHQFDPNGFESVSSNTGLNVNIGRVGRALYWIQAARSMPDLAMRVMAMCTALETLFSTSTSELTHQLAERTAVFLEDNYHERYEVFQLVKRAYSVRSQVAHGSALKPSKNEGLVSASQQLDAILRRIIQKAVAEKDSRDLFGFSNQDFDAAVIRMILSGSSGDPIAKATP